MIGQSAAAQLEHPCTRTAGETTVRTVYVPPCWAHRSVNTRWDMDLFALFGYPGNAGHYYTTIEQQGFRKPVVERNGKPHVIDNPRWRMPAACG